MVDVVEAMREIALVTVVIFVVMVNMDEGVMVPAFIHIAVELIILLIIVGRFMVVLCMPLLLLHPQLLMRQFHPDS